MSAPGWYPDPSGAPSRRYFDGTRWTDQYAPLPQAGPPARKSRVWLWVLLSVVGVLVLGFGGCVAFVGSVASNMEKVDSSAGSAQEPAAGVVGTPVRDGKFEFVVFSVKRQVIPGHQARGEWVVVTVSVTNIGNEPQSFFVQNQQLIDMMGREYAADSMVAMSLNQESMVLDLNPGFDIEVALPFDVPKGTTLAAMVLHDSMFSGGVTVSI